MAAALVLLWILGQRTASARRSPRPVSDGTGEAATTPTRIDAAECTRICDALAAAWRVTDAASSRCLADCVAPSSPRASDAETQRVAPVTAGTSSPQRALPRVAIESAVLPEDGDLIEFGTDVDAARTYVAPMPSELPDEVSHRSPYSRVFSQGDAPACSWLASLAALEESAQAELLSPVRLSAMHHLAHSHPRTWVRLALSLQYGPMDERAGDALTLRYDAALASRWMAGVDVMDDAVLARLDHVGTYAAVALRMVYRSQTTHGTPSAAIARALAAGLDVYASFRQSGAWHDASATETGVIPEGERFSESGHAVLIVGYRAGVDGREFAFRNSWARSWGDRGYGYVIDRVIDRDVRFAFALQAGHRGGLRACAPGTVESLDGSCHRVCANGLLDVGCDKPRWTDCGDGLALGRDGSCVRACRSVDVHDDGFEVRCTAPGCRWTVEDGLYGCHAGAGSRCTRFCPAPNCELMTNNAPDGTRVVGCGGAWDAI